MLKPAEIRMRLDAQEGRCRVCDRELEFDGGRPSPRANAAVADHCPSTGRVRGIVCMRCRSGLGFFDDDARRLLRAAAYLHGFWLVAKERDEMDHDAVEAVPLRVTPEELLQQAQGERFFEFSPELIAAVDEAFREVMDGRPAGPLPPARPVRPVGPSPRPRELRYYTTGWGEAIRLDDLNERVKTDPRIKADVDAHIASRVSGGRGDTDAVCPPDRQLMKPGKR